MATLALLRPIDAVLGERVEVRIASHNSREACEAGGYAWRPAMIEQPEISLQLFDGDFSSPVQPGSSSIEVDLGILDRSGQHPRVLSYDWAGCQVVLYRVLDGLPHSLADMRVTQFALEDLKVSLNLEVDATPLEADVLFEEYAGTTGLEGGADLTGRVKPWVFGRALNVEPVFIDQIDNVFQVSAYGPVEAISAVFERGASFGASLGDYADYAALVAADIPEGQWGTCIAQGLFRLGAPPAGVITCDVDGDNTAGFIRRTGAILAEIARRLDISDRVDAESLNALDAAVPRNVNIVIDQQTTFLDLARRMAAPCNAVGGLGLRGELITPRVVLSDPVMTLDAQGRQMPPVLGMARQNTSPPYRRIQMGANRSWRVHQLDEIAFFADLIDRGQFDETAWYREGNIVSLPDKRRFVYINPFAASGPGIKPPDATYWAAFEGAPEYADGTPIEDLKPAEANSDVTATSQRTITPEFPIIEIRRFEAGNVGTRTAGFVARAGETALSGGTWSLVATLLGEGTATINASNGLVSLSGIEQSGSFTVRYTHTDGAETDYAMNVSFIDQDASVRTINATPPIASWHENQTTSRFMAHTALEGSTALSGGTWSLVSTSSGITANTINASTGALEIISVTQNGNYRVRYTHTDTTETELVVNVQFYPASDPGRPNDPNWNISI